MTLRARVQLGLAMILIVVLAGGWFTISSQRSQIYEQVDERLVATPMPRSGPNRPGRGNGAPNAGAVDAVDRESISDLYVAVLDGDGSLRPLVEGRLLIDVPDLRSVVEDPPDTATLLTVEGLDETSTFRVLVRPRDDAALGEIIAVPTGAIENTIRAMSYRLLGVIGFITLALLLITSWVNRFGIRPIRAMADVAEAITSGERDRRAVADATEAGRLGHRFNLMLDERDLSDERLRRFISDASHELRTPLTSIRGYLDLYAAGGFRKPGELDDVLRRMGMESERMSLLVEDLLILAKFDEEQPLALETVRVDVLSQDVVALALAAHSEREIAVHAPAAVEVSADRLRLHQALAGLVDNAVQHTPPLAAISVTVTETSDGVELAVIDAGQGLKADEAVRIFDRFARGDASRTRKTGGSGLGLSITRAIVQAHNGEVVVTDTPGGGATFTIRIPKRSGS